MVVERVDKMSRNRTQLKEIIYPNHRKLNTISHFAPIKQNTLRHLQNEFRKAIPRPRYTFVTLVMCGDEYVKTQHELVVMVTADVNVPAMKDRVIKVQYTKTRVKGAHRGKKYRHEDTRMLNLTEYDKTVLLDDWEGTRKWKNVSSLP